MAIKTKQIDAKTWRYDVTVGSKHNHGFGPSEAVVTQRAREDSQTLELVARLAFMESENEDR